MTDHDVIDKAVSDYLLAAELLSGKPRPEGIRWAILAALDDAGRVIVDQGAIAAAERLGMERAAVICDSFGVADARRLHRQCAVAIRAELEDKK